MESKSESKSGVPMLEKPTTATSDGLAKQSNGTSSAAEAHFAATNANTNDLAQSHSGDGLQHRQTFMKRESNEEIKPMYHVNDEKVKPSSQTGLEKSTIIRFLVPHYIPSAATNNTSPYQLSNLLSTNAKPSDANVNAQTMPQQLIVCARDCCTVSDGLFMTLNARGVPTSLCFYPSCEWRDMPEKALHTHPISIPKHPIPCELPEPCISCGQERASFAAYYAAQKPITIAALTRAKRLGQRTAAPASTPRPVERRRGRPKRAGESSTTSSQRTASHTTSPNNAAHNSGVVKSNPKRTNNGKSAKSNNGHHVASTSAVLSGGIKAKAPSKRIRPRRRSKTPITKAQALSSGQSVSLPLVAGAPPTTNIVRRRQQKENEAPLPWRPGSVQPIRMRGRRTADSILLTSDNNNPNNDHPTTNSSTVPAGANHTDEALVLVGDPQTPCPPDWVEVWQCPEAGCGELAASDRLLARHIRMVHDNGMWRCPFYPTECEKTYKLAHHLTLHYSGVHQGVAYNTCDWPGCGSNFLNRAGLLQHYNCIHLKVHESSRVCDSNGLQQMTLKQRAEMAKPSNVRSKKRRRPITTKSTKRRHDKKSPVENDFLPASGTNDFEHANADDDLDDEDDDDEEEDELDEGDDMVEGEEHTHFGDHDDDVANMGVLLRSVDSDGDDVARALSSPRLSKRARLDSTDAFDISRLNAQMCMESETTPKATLTVSQPVAARKASMDFTFDEELPQTDLGHYDMEMRHFDEQSVNKEYDEQSDAFVPSYIPTGSNTTGLAEDVTAEIDSFLLSVS